MRNLESFGLQEMKTKELKITDGGYEIPWYVFALGPPGPVGYGIYKYIEGKYEQGAACN